MKIKDSFAKSAAFGLKNVRVGFEAWKRIFKKVEPRLERVGRWLNKKINSRIELAFQTWGVGVTIVFTFVQLTRLPILEAHYKTMPFRPMSPFDIVDLVYYLYPAMEYIFFIFGTVSFSTFLFYIGRKLSNNYVDDELTKDGIRERIDYLKFEEDIRSYFKDLVASHKNPPEQVSTAISGSEQATANFVILREALDLAHKRWRYDELERADP